MIGRGRGWGANLELIWWRKAFLSWWSRDLVDKKESHVKIKPKSFSGRRNSKCKGPELTSLEHSRKGKWARRDWVKCAVRKESSKKCGRGPRHRGCGKPFGLFSVQFWNQSNFCITCVHTANQFNLIGFPNVKTKFSAVITQKRSLAE